jgi:fumarate reductase subunit C
MSCRDRKACNMVWTSLVLIILLQAVGTGKEKNQDSSGGNYALLLQNDNADILYVITNQAALTVRACRFCSSCDEVAFVIVRVRTVKHNILRLTACHRHPGFSYSCCLGATIHSIARQNSFKAPSYFVLFKNLKNCLLMSYTLACFRSSFSIGSRSRFLLTF